MYNDHHFTHAGWLWPEPGASARRIETKARAARELNPAIDLCRRQRTAVQAGGHCGMFAHYLSRFFANVHTFEPDHNNFTALVYNVRNAPNVHAYKAALGMDRTGVNIVANEGGRSQGLHVKPDDELRLDGVDRTRSLRLDDLRLSSVDLVALDVEGYEAEALRGAADTITGQRPVVVLEYSTGYAERYGLQDSTAADLLAKWGYAERLRVGKYDRVYTHKDHWS